MTLCVSDRMSACAQQYSSATSSSLHFCFHKDKLGARLKIIIIVIVIIITTIIICKFA
jgi:hypothetical protein